jgi:flagellar capping protein FliD
MMSAQPMEARLASLEGSYHQVSDRLNGIDHRLDSIDGRLDGFEHKVEVRFNSMESRFQALDSKIDRLQWRMTALIAGTWITVMTSIFFHH